MSLKNWKIINHWWDRDGNLDWEYILKDIAALLFILLCIGLGIRS